MSVVDAYKSPPTAALRSYSDRKQSPPQTTPYSVDRHCERPPVENGDVEKTVNATPPRKRIKRSSSSSPQDCVALMIADGAAAATRPACTAAVLTPTTAVTSSLCVTQALPLAGRITGTVWQHVQSQSIAAPVTTNNGIFLCFRLTEVSIKR